MTNKQWYYGIFRNELYLMQVYSRITQAVKAWRSTQTQNESSTFLIRGTPLAGNCLQHTTISPYFAVLSVKRGAKMITDERKEGRAKLVRQKELSPRVQMSRSCFSWGRFLFSSVTASQSVKRGEGSSSYCSTCNIIVSRTKHITREKWEVLWKNEFIRWHKRS